MMCIQTPGSFVWVGSLAGRLGIEGWSTWGIYLVTGMLQGILLVMSISFEIRDWRQRKKADKSSPEQNGYATGSAGGRVQDDERTGLLENER